MLPATIAQDIRQQVLHYLEATFNFRRHEEEDALRRFINDPENGLFKGPWLQVRRPFRAAADKGEQYFDLPIPFLPFRHQWLACPAGPGRPRRVTGAPDSAPPESWMRHSRRAAP